MTVPGRVTRPPWTPRDTPDRPYVLPPPSDPGSILDQLDQTAQKHDELTSGYSTIVIEAAQARHVYELAYARARQTCLRTPAEGRRTVADLDGEVTIMVAAERERLLMADAHLDALKRLLRNAELNLDRLRTAAATARTLDPRGA